MKKIIALFLVLVSVISVFSACALKPGMYFEPYITYITGTDYWQELSSFADEIELLTYIPKEIYMELRGAVLDEDGEYSLPKNKDCRKKKTLVYHKEEYNVKFSYSESGYFCYYTMYTPNGEQNKYPLLYFKGNTNKLVKLVKSKMSDSQTEESLQEPEKYLEQAKKYASEFIKDFDDYELSVSVKNNVYSYKYTRMIDGYPSIDSYEVDFTSDGSLYGFDARYTGCLEKKKFSIDEEKVNESVNEKLKTTFADHGYELISYTKFTYNDVPFEPQIVITKDGMIGVEAKYQCIVKDADGKEYDPLEYNVFTTVDVNNKSSKKTDEITWREIE